VTPSILNFLSSAARPAAPLAYAWDDWDPYPLIAPNDRATEEALAFVSNWAKFAYSIGCAEWVAARLTMHDEDPAIRQYLDACWAYELTDRYELPPEMDDANWRGAVRGPICLALTTIVNTRYGFDEQNAQGDAAFAEKVALHVLPDTAFFTVWRQAVLKRYSEHYRITEEDSLEERPVPMHILNADFAYDQTQLQFYIEDSLHSLQLRDNPFADRIVPDAPAIEE
jgi:hypothetical protein